MTTTHAPSTVPTVRILTAAWAAAFGVLHVVWATGSTVGLGTEADGAMTGWFLAYDVAVVFGCAIGAALAWVGSPRWVLWTIASLLLLRGALGLLQGASALASGDGLGPTFWVEPYFALGAVAFGLSARTSRSETVRPVVGQS